MKYNLFNPSGGSEKYIKDISTLDNGVYIFTLNMTQIKTDDNINILGLKFSFDKPDGIEWTENEIESIIITVNQEIN